MTSGRSSGTSAPSSGRNGATKGKGNGGHLSAGIRGGVPMPRRRERRTHHLRRRWEEIRAALGAVWDFKRESAVRRRQRCGGALPGMFEELDALEKVGVDCAGRMIVSDRAHLLFELHKEVDGLREAELSGDKIGTTKRGIGPAYASATRNGIRVGDIKNMDTFAEKLKTLAADAGKRFEGFEYDVDAEIQRYGKIRERILPFIADTVEIVNQAPQRIRRKFWSKARTRQC